MQIVAFPQSGLTNRPGTEALMDAALREGADVVGGIDPCAIDRDPVRCLDVTFALASRHGRPIDIHLHEPGEMGAFSLDLILERTQALGMQGRVVVSHGFCLGAIPDRDRDGLLARMARLDVAIATTAPASGPVPPLAACRAAGVTVFGGNDGIRDTWTPYARARHARPRHAYRPAQRAAPRRRTGMGARMRHVERRPRVWVRALRAGVGDRADLVLVDAATVAEAVVAAPPRRLVVAAGRVATTPP